MIIKTMEEEGKEKRLYMQNSLTFTAITILVKKKKKETKTRFCFSSCTLLYPLNIFGIEIIYLSIYLSILKISILSI